MLHLLLVLTSALWLLGMPSEVAPTVLAELAVEASDDCHCCLDGDEEEGDCCDQDLGACCAAGMAAALPTAAVPRAERAAAVPGTPAVLPLHLLRPRDNGPPPTPPPIG